MRNGMIEAKHISMKAQAMARIISISIFDIATYRMSHIGSMNTYLVLTPRLQFKFYKRIIS